MSDTEVRSDTEVAVGNTRPPPQTCVSKNSRSRGWCFTINNPNDDDWERVDGLDTEYLCYAKEVGDLGTEHIQGYAYFKTPRFFTAMKKRLPHAHLEMQRGTAQDNRQYIFGPYEKDGKYKPANDDACERGTLPIQGKRNDLITAASEISTKKQRLNDLCLDADFQPVIAKHIKFFEKLEGICQKKEAFDDYHSGWRPQVFVYWSRRSGAGKTRQAYNRGSGVTSCMYTEQRNKYWFAYYDPGDVLLFDEFVGQISFETMKIITDIYPLLLPLKGGFAWRLKSDIVITSNVHPRDWWGGLDQEEFAHLERRLTIQCMDI